MGFYPQHGMGEVTGSIPIRSTNKLNNLADQQENAIRFRYIGLRAETMFTCELLPKTASMLRTAASTSAAIRTKPETEDRLLSPLTVFESTVSGAEAELYRKLFFVVFEFAHVAVRLDDSTMDFSECPICYSNPSRGQDKVLGTYLNPWFRDQ